jgi:hypothetical protein
MTRSDQLEQGESAMSEPLQIETSLEGRSVCLAL